jgi:23S rRNA pseudouridine2605 synthase
MKTVALNRALSKLGILSRAQATEAIQAGRVRVRGRIVTNPLQPVVPERVHIVVDGEPKGAFEWRTILFHKPRGVVTTRRDPEGRRTIYDVLGEAGRGLVAVGRLDLATSGLLLLTTDTRLADWITDPRHAVPRIYVAAVRGNLEVSGVARLTAGIGQGRDRLQAHAVTILKSSSRESRALIELREGKNREVRRMFQAIDRPVTELKRIRLGGLELGALEPGHWRDVSRAEVARAFPEAKIRARRSRSVQRAKWREV